MIIASYRQFIIAVCGAGRTDGTLDALAEAVGRRLAEAGALLGVEHVMPASDPTEAARLALALAAQSPTT